MLIESGALLSSILERNISYIEKLLYAHPGTNMATRNLRAQIREIDNEMVRFILRVVL